MPHFAATVKSIKAGWAKRLLCKSNNFTKIATACMKIKDIKTFFSYKLKTEYMNPKPSLFYNQVVSFFFLYIFIEEDIKME